MCRVSAFELVAFISVVKFMDCVPVYKGVRNKTLVSMKRWILSYIDDVSR